MTSCSHPINNFAQTKIILSENDSDNRYKKLNLKRSGITMWFERWFLSSNAKDIGVLYLIYALFSGLIKPELTNLAICLESVLILLFFIIIQKYLWADNYIYRNLRDFTQELFIIYMFSFLFLIHTFNLYYFFCTSNLELFNFNLQTNLFILVLFSIKNKVNLLKKQSMSTNCSTNYKNELGSYLAGLIESDGSLVVPKNVQNRPTIKIVFNLKDKPLAKCLMDTIKSGSIQSASENSVEYVVRDKIGIVNIVNLINGEFRTPKIGALHNLIDWINANPKYNSSKFINKMPLNITPLTSNSWFSGFSYFFLVIS